MWSRTSVLKMLSRMRRPRKKSEVFRMMNAVAVRRMRKDAAMIMETRQYSLPSVRFRWHSPAFTRLYVFPECNAGE